MWIGLDDYQKKYILENYKEPLEEDDWPRICEMLVEDLINDYYFEVKDYIRFFDALGLPIKEEIDKYFETHDVFTSLPAIQELIFNSSSVSIIDWEFRAESPFVLFNPFDSASDVFVDLGVNFDNTDEIINDLTTIYGFEFDDDTGDFIAPEGSVFTYCGGDYPDYARWKYYGEHIPELDYFNLLYDNKELCIKHIEW